MVAVIKTGCSLRNIFSYNENKVKLGVAECIGERNYPVDVNKMNSAMKLNRLLKQISLNENVTRNSVHISLNFHPSETSMTNEKMADIANKYMQKIGFENQPYLIYRHYDAGHPHIHLVSIKVREDGSRIDMHNIGRNQSETARKEIEKSFNLIPAEGRKKSEETKLHPIETGKVHYGKIQSKKAISSVLSSVLSSYKYTSLAELNAVLKQYNVMADRGNENSRVFKAGGLVYRILNDEGKPTGVPIKASDFYNKPTLKFLEEKFISNNLNRTVQYQRIKNAVDFALLGDKLTLRQLEEKLIKEGINMVLRKSEAGHIYGITYVDHKTKCVFNGSVLGKQYSAKAIQQRCELNLYNQQIISVKTPENVKAAIPPAVSKRRSKNVVQEINSNENTFEWYSSVGKMIDMLLQPEHDQNYIPGQLKGKRRKKKKRKGQSDNL